MINTIKHSLFFIALTLLAHDVYSQKNTYIATDSSLNSGVNLISGSAKDNAQFIRLKEDSIRRYSPEQLAEYRLTNGSVYESRSIKISGQTKKVFLERLEYGKINLYFYTEKGIPYYYLEKDSATFIELTENNLQKQLSEVTADFGWTAGQLRLVKFNRKSLSKFISMYNLGNDKPLPYERFGLIGGYNRTNLIMTPDLFIEQLDGVSFSPSSSTTLGAFADLPILMSYFSFNVGVNFSKSEFSVDSRKPQSVVNAVVNITSVSIPFLVRYTVPTLVWRPFVNAGGIYTNHFKSESKIYEFNLNQTVPTFDEVNHRPLISDAMFGYSFGLGIQRNLNYRKIVSAELRLYKLYGKPMTLNKSELEILIGFSF